MSIADAIDARIPGDYYSRGQWGAPANPGGNYRDPDRVSKLTAHITTGDNLGRRDTADWVKSIYDYHTGHLGWADIGYALLYDRYGNVFEGRGLQRQLAHAKGYNIEWLGVAYLGAIHNELTDRAKKAFLGLRGALLDADMDVEDVNGHRDVSSKSCPGDAVYDWIADGMPQPGGAEAPEPREADNAPDYVVAVIASNDIDEGMARTLGHAYRWKFLRASDLDGVTIGTAVRVGAARSIDDGPWSDTHDVGGPDRDATARAVMERIRVREGDSRSVT